MWSSSLQDTSSFAMQVSGTGVLVSLMKAIARSTQKTETNVEWV
jgi:hypothetical protein